MRDIESLGEAVDTYLQDYNSPPDCLQQLVPVYIDYIPKSPWNTSYLYSTHPDKYFEITLALPSAVCKDITQLKYANNGFLQYADCTLTDEEKHWFTYYQLSTIRIALGVYLVDYNFCASNLQILVDDHYIEPASSIYDLYNHLFLYTLKPDKIHYTVIAPGKDSIPGNDPYEVWMNTGQFTYLPDPWSIYKYQYKKGIFEGGLLPK